MRLLTLLACSLHVTAASAQVPVKTEGIEQAMEVSASAMTESEQDDYGRAWEADRILHARFPVNSVDPDRLAEWVGLTPMQAVQYRLYRERFGPFIDLMELQAVPGWDLETVRRAIPWLRLAADPGLLPVLRERWEKGHHQFLLRFSSRMEGSGERMQSNVGTGHAGGGTSALFRYRFQFRNLLQLGFAMEKDAGERLFIQSSGGPFDFQSFHFGLREVGRLRSFMVGDFQVNLGQGLIHWQGLAFRKTADAAATLRQGQGVRPYQGNDENRFHRGVAAGFDFGRWSLSLFLAMDRMDGNLVWDSLSPVPWKITSLQTSGLHRSVSEIQDRDAFRQRFVGTMLTFKKDDFRAAVNGVGYGFKVPLAAGDRPADRYDIEGDRWRNLSTDYGWTWRNMHLFGEAAVDARGAKALLQGLLMSLHSRLDLSLVIRDIAPGYRALQAQAFTEQSTPMNEKGLYAGIVLRPHPAWRVDAYADAFHFPDVTHTIDRPSRGAGRMVNLQWKPRRQVEMTLRWQTENKEANASCQGCNLRDIVMTSRSGLRWQTEVDRPGGFTFRSRVECAWYREAGIRGEGFMVFADFRYKPMVRPYSLAARICLFDTEGYDTRIYAYENDVPFSHSMSALYGSGLRVYLLTGIKMGNGGQVAFRAGFTGFRDPGGSVAGKSAQKGRLDLRLQVTREL